MKIILKIKLFLESSSLSGFVNMDEKLMKAIPRERTDLENSFSSEEIYV